MKAAYTALAIVLMCSLSSTHAVTVQVPPTRILKSRRVPRNASKPFVVPPGFPPPVKGEATRTYDENYAILGTYLAAAAYCPLSSINAWTCAACQSVPGFQVSKVFAYQETATFGYVGVLPSFKLIAVAFRGTTPTTNLQSILQDLKFFKTDPLWGIPGALVHKGFLQSYESASDLVRTQVNQLQKQYPTYKVGVFGHSLGGAMATLAALDLSLYGNVTNLPLAPTVTVGQPRVGNPSFASFYDEYVSTAGGHWRVVHHRDVVPHLPPMLMNFFHIADEVWYDQDDMSRGSAHTICYVGESEQCSDGLTFKTSVPDHLSYFNFHVSGDC